MAADMLFSRAFDTRCGEVDSDRLVLDVKQVILNTSELEVGVGAGGTVRALYKHHTHAGVAGTHGFGYSDCKADWLLAADTVLSHHFGPRVFVSHSAIGIAMRVELELSVAVLVDEDRHPTRSGNIEVAVAVGTLDNHSVRRSLNQMQGTQFADVLHGRLAAKVLQTVLELRGRVEHADVVGGVGEVEVAVTDRRHIVVERAERHSCNIETGLAVKGDLRIGVVTESIEIPYITQGVV